MYSFVCHDCSDENHVGAEQYVDDVPNKILWSDEEARFCDQDYEANDAAVEQEDRRARPLPRCAGWL
jgi:hypothetical protein